jgi:stalled ribosome rescue protein Dom34
MSHYHAIVWIDHREARIFHFNPDEADRLVIHADKPSGHLHHKAGSMTGKRLPEDQAFLHSVADALKDAHEWIVVGPGSAKLELVKHVHRHDVALADRIVGVESMDKVHDGELVKYARRYAKNSDHLRPQLG